jgi:hypothetical protein
MITLFDATRPVKPSRRFGAGLLAYVPHVQHAYEPTEADWAGLREIEARRDAANRRIDCRASEAAAHARYENGWL